MIPKDWCTHRPPLPPPHGPATHTHKMQTLDFRCRECNWRGSESPERVLSPKPTSIRGLTTRSGCKAPRPPPVPRPVLPHAHGPLSSKQPHEDGIQGFPAIWVPQHLVFSFLTSEMPPPASLTLSPPWCSRITRAMPHLWGELGDPAMLQAQGLGPLPPPSLPRKPRLPRRLQTAWTSGLFPRSLF